ncbi:DnaA regulatory inactivator Hda [Neptuniibacter sp. CAU 1671]|uniref:DnaA regulatory inactivator Hda n=1 Tax=Neptuniibacter sp. CAU 1671 TaxID=3032593 RepID=UPI0023DAA5CD|nr:DnaA regulatory inactivator Hda [Neptuniibacter sp. CAU 1671]MDF2183147.1 DnaA regulatory inactivator Hda [Neptuniibacter sp. CAU 1671]
MNTTDKPLQLPLHISLRDDARFANFCAHGNELALHSLQQSINRQGESFIYLWGAAGSGCTHLLQASCHQAEPAGLSAAYLPLEELRLLGPDILEGMEFLDLVCIDHLQQVAGDPAWEESLFHFFNRIREQGNTLLVAADAAPRQLSIGLPDLASRLGWGVVFQIQPLGDDDKRRVLQQRAAARGMALSEEVARYLLNHASRDMNDLSLLLDQLDQASLSAKRKLTIPFIKEVTGL